MRVFLIETSSVPSPPGVGGSGTGEEVLIPHRDCNRRPFGHTTMILATSIGFSTLISNRCPSPSVNRTPTPSSGNHCLFRLDWGWATFARHLLLKCLWDNPHQPWRRSPQHLRGWGLMTPFFSTKKWMKKTIIFEKWVKKLA